MVKCGKATMTERFTYTTPCALPQPLNASFGSATGKQEALLINMRLLLADPLVALANAIAPPEVKEQVRRRERG
jgi:hypothetical protein